MEKELFNMPATHLLQRENTVYEVRVCSADNQGASSTVYDSDILREIREIVAYGLQELKPLKVDGEFVSVEMALEESDVTREHRFARRGRRLRAHPERLVFTVALTELGAKRNEGLEVSVSEEPAAAVPPQTPASPWVRPQRTLFNTPPEVFAKLAAHRMVENVEEEEEEEEPVEEVAEAPEVPEVPEVVDTVMAGDEDPIAEPVEEKVEEEKVVEKKEEQWPENPEDEWECPEEMRHADAFKPDLFIVHFTPAKETPEPTLFARITGWIWPKRQHEESKDDGEAPPAKKAKQ